MKFWKMLLVLIAIVGAIFLFLRLWADALDEQQGIQQERSIALRDDNQTQSWWMAYHLGYEAGAAHMAHEAIARGCQP